MYEYLITSKRDVLTGNTAFVLRIGNERKHALNVARREAREQATMMFIYRRKAKRAPWEMYYSVSYNVGEYVETTP